MKAIDKMSGMLPQTKGALLSVLFAVSSASLITSNLCSIKVADVMGISLGLGVSTIVVDYIVSDVCVEVFGFKKALSMRRWAMICNVASALILSASVAMPAAREFELQDAFASVLLQSPRMVVASMAAYMCGTWVNNKVMDVCKRADGEEGLFKRCILSSVAGDLVDGVVCCALMYGFTYSLAANIGNVLLSFAIKIAMEVVVFHVATKRVIKWAKGLDGEGAA